MSTESENENSIPDVDDDELPTPLAISRLIRSIMAEDDQDDPALPSYQEPRDRR